MIRDTNGQHERFARSLSLRGLFAVTVWGASFVATRIALESFNPFGLVAFRLLAAALLLGIVIRARGGRLLPTRADLPVCLLLGVTLAAHLLMQAYGLRYTSAINTGWIIGFIPVTIALGAHLLRQQHLNAFGWIGVVVGTGGVLTVTAVAPPDFTHARFGDLLQIASCFTWTIYTLAGAGPIARNGALRVTACAMAIAATIVTLATLGTDVTTGPLTLRGLVALAFLGLVCSGVAYYVWFAASHDRGPTRVAALLYFEPFVTLVVAAALLHEPITLNAIVGGLIVLVGVWLVGRGASRTSPGKPEPVR
ncbi:MAG: DMT family transporter [Planctomycetes bacterium]|nr:DMT family transporter [Planctomycetota bacterium]